jgi:hypothetical protein
VVQGRAPSVRRGDHWDDRGGARPPPQWRVEAIPFGAGSPPPTTPPRNRNLPHSTPLRRSPSSPPARALVILASDGQFSPQQSALAWRERAGERPRSPKSCRHRSLSSSSGCTPDIFLHFLCMGRWMGNGGWMEGSSPRPSITAALLCLARSTHGLTQPKGHRC